MGLFFVFFLFIVWNMSAWTHARMAMNQNKDEEEEEEEEEEDDEVEEGDGGDEEDEDEHGASDDSDGVLDSDDGDGGRINVSLAADLPSANLSRQQTAAVRQLPGLALPAGGTGGRGLKRLVPDKEQDDIMSEIFRDLVPRKRRRRRKRKVTARGGLVLPPDVEALLGEANTEYAYGNFDQAREKLLEVIRICPSCPDAYTTLGLIHDERKEAAKALDFLIIAAHLTPKDAEMWADLAQRSRTLGKLKQAIYCLNRAIKIEPTADDLLWDKAQLLQETSQNRRAIDVLSALLKKIHKSNYGKVRGFIGFILLYLLFYLHINICLLALLLLLSALLALLLYCFTTGDGGLAGAGTPHAPAQQRHKGRRQGVLEEWLAARDAFFFFCCCSPAALLQLTTTAK